MPDEVVATEAEDLHGALQQVGHTARVVFAVREQAAVAQPWRVQRHGPEAHCGQQRHHAPPGIPAFRPARHEHDRIAAPCLCIVDRGPIHSCRGVKEAVGHGHL